MYKWQKLMRRIIQKGEQVSNERTGVGTVSLHGASIWFDLGDGFPAVTTKKLFIHAVAGEMAAFISGSHNVEQFQQAGCNFWNVNAADPKWLDNPHRQFEGDLGRIYGVQWRDWRGANGGTLDQLQTLVDGIKANPGSRRHIVTAWNPAELDQMCLPPCPLLFQCFVSQDYFLDMVVYQRSCDVFLGLPCDIAGYALLQHLIAKETRLNARRLTFMIGDAHLYLNHLKAVSVVLDRKPNRKPTLVLAEDASLFSFSHKHVWLNNYNHQGVVPAELNN